MAPATTSSSSYSPSSEEILPTSTTDDDNFNQSTFSIFPSVSPGDFLYDNNSTPSTTNFTSISDSDNDIHIGAIAVGGLDDLAMISSAEVMNNDDDFYRPQHLLHSPRQHVSVAAAATYPSNATAKSGSDSANSNFMFLLEDLGEYFYNYNSTSNGDSGNSGYYFSGITSTGFPNTTDFDYRTQNCSNVTCIDPIAGSYCFY